MKVAKKNVAQNHKKTANNQPRTGSKKPAVKKADPAFTKPNKVFASYHAQLPLPESRAISDGINEDPIGEEPVNVEHRVDRYDVTIDYAAALSQKQYFDKAGSPHRIHWRMPLATQKVADGDVTLDSRGLLSDLVSAHVEFTNELQDDIKIAINTPIAKIGSPDEIVNRVNSKTYELKPGQSRTYKVNWKADVNLFQPLIQKVTQGDDSFHAAVIADYAIVVPDVSAQSNTAYNVTRNVCGVKTSVKYVSEKIDEMMRVSGTKVFLGDVFSISTINGVSAMLKVEGEIMQSTQDGGRGTVFAGGIINWQENSSSPCMTLRRLPKSGTNDDYIQLVKCDHDGVYTGPIEIAPYQTDYYEVRAPIGFCPSPELGRAATEMYNYGVQTTFRYNRARGAWLMNGQLKYDEPFTIDRNYFPTDKTAFPICSLQSPITIYDTRRVTYDEEGKAIDPAGPYAFSPVKFMRGVLEVLKTGVQIASIVGAFV